MGIALWPMSKLFEAGTRVRARLYASGRLRRRRLNLPVVSIGNLSVGGTGKTPFTIWLYGQLVEHGLKPAVLTRGYRRTSREPTLIIGNEGIESGEGAGDEVQVMLRHGVAPIGVDANRFRAGTVLAERFSPDLFLLDDGFQHLELDRDLDVVLLDASRPLWRERVLPAGMLREPFTAVRRAQVAVITRVQKWSDVELLYAQLKVTAPQLDVLRARTALWNAGAPGKPLASGLAFAFAGVGNPKAFFADLVVAGARVVGTRRFRDHHAYSARDLRGIAAAARKSGAEELITTEKDSANISPELRATIQMPLRVAAMRLEVEGGDRLIEHVLTLVRSGPRA